MQRHRITDAQFAFIEPQLPKSSATVGRPPADARLMLDGLMWMLRTGAPWRDLPAEQFGPWQTVYHYRNLWRADGTLDQILLSLQVRSNHRGKIDWDLWCIDGSVARAGGAAAASLLLHPEEPADHALGRSRGGFTSKFHLIPSYSPSPEFSADESACRVVFTGVITT